MGQGTYIDPIAHAWRCCNPHTPLPSALERGALSTFALRLHSSNAQRPTELSGTKDTHHGLLTVATLTRISLPMGE